MVFHSLPCCNLNELYHKKEKIATDLSNWNLKNNYIPTIFLAVFAVLIVRLLLMSASGFISTRAHRHDINQKETP